MRRERLLKGAGNKPQIDIWKREKEGEKTCTTIVKGEETEENRKHRNPSQYKLVTWLG